MTFLFRFSRRIFCLLAMQCLLYMCLCSPSWADSEQRLSHSAPVTVNLGVITLYHPLVMYRNYQPFIDYLTENTPYIFTLKISENYYQIIDYLSQGSVQAAILGGRTYIEAKKKVEILPLLAALGQDGTPTCRGVFITRSDNANINDLDDIRGKRFAFASIRSTSGNLMPLYHLYKTADIHLSDFKSYVNLKYHDAVVREVLRGNYDAGVALSTIAGQYKDVGLKFIGQTYPFPGFVLVVRKDAPPEMVETIRNSLLAMDYQDKRHRRIMRDWDINIRYGFTPTSDAVYEKFQEVLIYLSSQGIEWR